MKSILALLLTFAMSLSLAACGGDQQPEPEDSDTQQEETTKDQAEDIDFDEIMSGNGDTNRIWGKEDEAAKQALIASGKEDGLDISFGSDGSMTVKDIEEGTTIVQNTDGSWSYEDEDGNTAAIGGEWPDNEFTKLVPKPDFTVAGTSAESDEFSVAFADVSIDALRTYADKVMAAGFDVDVSTEDLGSAEVEIFTFTAKNSDGYSVDIFSAAGATGMTIEKP